MVARLAFAPIEWSTVKDNVEGLLTAAILSGRIKPGERLNESQLARELHVSRAPIREALLRLQQQGLVMNHPRRGMFVVHLDDEDIQKINNVRLPLEAEALRLCRARLTREVEAKLVQSLEKLERSETAAPHIRARLDFEFHRRIWSFTGNEYLERSLNSLAAPLFAHSVLRILKTEKVRHIIYSHRPLLAFIQGKTKDSAEKVIADHFKVPWTRP